MTKATSKARAVGYRKGFRSGLEKKIAASLTRRRVVAGYEAVVVKYVRPARTSRYTPDWTLPNGIIVESKGQFPAADRQKHLLIRAQHPDLDIRFVFSRSATRISKQSKTTYADWCRSHGFRFADADIPGEWIEEPPEPARCAALAALTKETR